MFLYTFTGDKKKYQHWKVAFLACVDQAPATAEYKLLQWKQCLAGEALKAIEGLGHSAAAYQATKERLERKFGGQRRQLAIYLEEIDSFRPVHPGNFKDMEKYADLLDIAIVNLKEANHFEELRDGLLYMKLQKKLPASMLTRYHRWIYENHKIELVEVLREWVIQETEFQTKAIETIQGLSRKQDMRSNTREIPHTFFGKQNQGTGSEPPTKYRICKLCNKSHGIWTCSEFKAMEVPKRWEYAKKSKLCFRCLGEGHSGQSCFRTRVCGLDGCKEVNHRLLHRQAINKNSTLNKNSDDATKLHQQQTGCNVNNDVPQQQKHVDVNPSVKTAGLISEGENADGNEDATMMSETSKTMGNVALRTVTVYLKNGDRKLKINALLDDASTKTYINADVAVELGLQGHPQKVKVNVLNGQVETFETTPVECVLESLEGKSFKISALTTNRVTGNMRVTDWSTCAEQWPHLRGITFHKLGSRPIVDLLIGLDSADLHYSFKDVRGEPGQPIARLTPLGWTCVGDLGQIDQHNATTNFVTTYFVSEDAKMDELNATLHRFWEIDNSRMESSPAMTKQESYILKKAEESIMFSDGQYQIAIPWKEDKLQLPDNYKVALDRLQNLERRLLKRPQMAVAYNEVITKYLEKEYIRKIEPSEKQPEQKWYLPHFAILKSD